MPTTDPPRAPRAVRRCLPEDERVVRVLKPHPLFILLRALPALLACAVVGIAALALDRVAPLGPWTGLVLAIAGLVALARLAWAFLDWSMRWYARTDVRALRVSGVLNRRVTEVPLASIRATVADLPVVERVFGLGSVGFATAATDGYELVWATIADPSGVMADVSAVASDSPFNEPVEVATPGTSRPFVIGIAGGIGAGKSAVARAFASLGCVVSDSDRDTDDALAREDVRAALRSWWGPEVITPEGAVDRKRVASIVFGDDEQRLRLEGLIHPLVHAARGDRIARAAREGAPAVIVDAPLLFEAGVDRECDAVVYVQASREVRLERVSRTRGWDEGDLDAREKAQLPLERKRQRSDYVIVNEGHEQDLVSQADRVLHLIRTQRPPTPA